MEKGDIIIQIFQGTALVCKSTLEDVYAIAMDRRDEELRTEIQYMVDGILSFLERNPETFSVGYMHDSEHMHTNGRPRTYFLALNRELELGEHLDRNEIGKGLVH